MIFALLLFVIPGTVLSGSVCPPRPDIYPCSCANVPLSKRHLATVVTCHGMPDSQSLEDVLLGLRDLDIDQLHLYDAFWGKVGEEASLPSDWLTLLKVKEMAVGDSNLAPCFMCQWRMNCRNGVTTRFAITNSSSAERICSVCDRGAAKQPWTNCLSNLREFSFTRGRLTSLGADLFPLAMRELTLLNVSRNQIVKVDSNTLKNLPALISLDLSHNAIEYIDHMFAGQVLKLQYLDVSWNFIKSVGGDLFSPLPQLRSLKADNNLLTEMRESEWRNAPTTLKYIDFRENPMNCNCNMRWVNGSFSISTLVLGTCSTPPEYSRSPIRRASRFLTQRCSPEGVLGTRPHSTSTTTATSSTSTTGRPRRRHA